MPTDNLSSQPKSQAKFVDAKLSSIWRLAWPSIVGNVFGTMVGIFHLKIISDLGPSAVSAVVTGHRFFFLLQAIIIAASIGASALVAQNWGAGNKREAHLMASTAMLAAIMISITLSLPGLFFSSYIAAAFGLQAEATAQSAEFIYWLSVFNLISALNIMVSAILRATGDVIAPLYLAVVTSLANIAGASTLGLGLLGMPRMGISGIGIGAGLGITLTTLIFIGLWLSKRFQIKPVLKGVFNRKRLKKLFNIAIPIALEQGVIQFSLLAFMAIVAIYGTPAYAAYGIGITLLSLSFVIGIGFGAASATIIGQLLGAGEPQLAAKSGWKAMWLAVTLMSLLGLCMAFFSKDLAAVMSDDPEVIAMASVFLQILAFAQPVMAIEFSLSGALRGAGDTRFPLLSTFSGLFFGRILLALLFVKLGLSIEWIFAVSLVDFSIKSSMLVWRFHRGHWQRKFMIMETSSR